MRDQLDPQQESGGAGTEGLVSRFQQLQEERVITYRHLEEGHKKYLSSGPQYDFPTYRQCVHEATQAFTKISEGILEVEAALRHASHTALADILQAIQECERKKLELTVHLQLARQMAEEESSGELEQDKVRELRCQLAKVVEDINDLLIDLRYETCGEPSN